MKTLVFWDMTLYYLFTSILEAPVAPIYYSEDEDSMSSETCITTYSTTRDDDDDYDDADDDDDNDDDNNNTNKEQNQNLQHYERITSHAIVLICCPLKVNCMTVFCTVKKEMWQVVIHKLAQQ